MKCHDSIRDKDENGQFTDLECAEPEEIKKWLSDKTLM